MQLAKSALQDSLLFRSLWDLILFFLIKFQLREKDSEKQHPSYCPDYHAGVDAN